MSKKTTRRAMLASVVALALCITMLIGTTYAWFTDSVASSGNIIKSGTLDIDLLVKGGNTGLTEYTSVKTSQAPIFNYDLWEPGYTVVANAKVVTNGTLALKYTMKIVAEGAVSELADVIDVYYAPTEVNVADRNLTGLTKLGTLKDAIDGTIVINDTLIPAEAAAAQDPAGTANLADFATLALHMQESAGNEYQDKSIGTSFSLQIFATQYTYEKDSFDNQYDKDATFVVNDSASLASVLETINNATGDEPANIALGGDFAFTDTPLTVEEGKDVTIDLNGHDLSINNAADDGLVVKDGATLTLTNSGTDGEYTFNTISDVNDGIYVVSETANETSTINIENVVININSDQWISIHAEGKEGGKAVVNINDGAVINITGNSDIAGFFADNGGTVNMNGGEININGTGDYRTDAVGIIVGDQAHGTGLDSGVVNITGGVINVRGTSFACGVQVTDYANDNNKVNMTGGVINVEGSGSTDSIGIGVYNRGQVSVTGGKINVQATSGDGTGIYLLTANGVANVASADLIEVSTTAGGNNQAYVGTNVTIGG